MIDLFFKTVKHYEVLISLHYVSYPGDMFRGGNGAFCISDECLFLVEVVGMVLWSCLCKSKKTTSYR